MNFIKNGSITSPEGFLSSGIHVGLKKNKKDLALIYSKTVGTASGVYTKNKVKGAPIYVTKEHLENNKAQAIIINSGNANTLNGEEGLKNAEEMSILAANSLKIDKSNVLVASTGVIGVPLNIELIKNGIDNLTSSLTTNSSDAASAILTTDTYTKECAVEFLINDKKITIGSIAKGSGMIEPNMGTMLSFITTDISISESLLSEALKESVNISYNRVSVDGDTSTNDMVLIIANGEAKNKTITTKDENYYKFLEALNALNLKQAKRIARDGEGATKLISCNVVNAPSIESAELLSKSVIKSSLVKTAMFGEDANFGRILCALGYSNGNFDPNLVDVYFKSHSTIKVCENGFALPFDEDIATDILKDSDITIIVDLKLGKYEATSFGCDLSYDYVKINAEYRS
ncbi:bifunctional ornithine acetyltransferase/N-acetylglutamate synthase [Clostridium baratii]|uniref:bifunctional glutamate N-acetyltransferase/amino-acid acetyltransferase ArgJ n=1 Tax=Clostridium baratii TaxID=1561 RepID=UPI0009A26BB8|nr:bifunctional glutamate N-acetyltransferase/amino-acid acetyltransferase ArgJ [Clostridium baratii]OPF50787.1 arginine biosynthesis protein ArgJ [Clostridium baratii]OPF54595.1 bifunctional ornithine acetyltransferase/N-acetylglutamate synthase [Clostridium baratii]OPF54901.1 bifunctional ornithine acetyltransferase/N-acetylglutamate synthase [Clostridium baratii]OPF59096.1 bifunctional ornithine acetyltransferase/N-acetylglutamate synthase [Clostridium baratii]